jgi:fatty acid desaturase
MNEKHRYLLCKYRALQGLPGTVNEASGAKQSRDPLGKDSQSAFHTDVKDLLQKHFKGHGVHAHKATRSHCCVMAVVVTAYAAAWLGWLRGSCFALLVLPWLAWLIMANLAHDGSHFAVSRHSWVNQLCLYGASPLYYTDATSYMQHILSHHLETNNFEGDVDLHHHGAARWHPEKATCDGQQGRRNLLWHATAFMGSTVILAIVQPLTKFVVPGVFCFCKASVPRLWGSSEVFERVLSSRLSAGFATAHRVGVNALLWAWAAAVPVLSLWSHGATPKAALFMLYPFVVSSMLFMVVTQCSHIQRETQTREALQERDFFKQQAMTSLDYSCGSFLWGFWTGGLNTQSLHHVAPSVHSSHYPDIYPKFHRLCIKHGCAPPLASHIGLALAKHLRYVFELGNGYTLPVPEM